MVCRQGWVVQSPILKVIEVPLRYRQMRCDLHPVPLSFKIPVHWRRLKARVAPEASCPSK